MAATKKKPKKKTTRKPPDRVLVIRTCDKDGKSHGGFHWPESGPVECPDFKATYTCGNGLHGLLWGQGNWGLTSSEHDAKWLVVETDRKHVLTGQGDLTDKCKFPGHSVAGTKVVFSGNQATALAFLLNSDLWKQEIASSATGKIAEGSGSTVAADGNYSRAASSGNSSRAASSGDYSSAASSGDYSSAEGIGAKCIAASVGYGGRVKAGIDGCVIACWWDRTAERPRAVVGYVGEDGIKADTWYEAKDGKLVEC